MARTFDGTNDEIRTSIGNAGVTGAITMVVVFRRNATDYNALMALHTSGGTATYALEIADNASGNLFDFTGTRDWADGNPAVVNADGWVLAAVTKATGTVTPRAHKYVYTTGAWTHTANSTTVANQASVAGGTVRFGEWQDVDDFAGEIAIAAIYGASLTDAQIETLAHDLDAWYALGPAGLWIFDQAAVGNLPDLTGGGANQSAITGTSVAGSAPPGPHYGGWPAQVAVSAPSGAVSVTPTTATLTTATFAPTVLTPVVVTPDTASLTTATFAVTIDLRVTPDTASLTLSTFAPTVTVGGNQSVTPDTATLTLSTFAPTVLTPVLVTPDTASLTTATFAPSVLTPVLVTPDTATLTLSTFAPTVTAGGSQSVTPTTATLTLSTFAPTVTTSGNQLVTPTTASLTLLTFEPSVLTPRLVTPTMASLTLSLFAPTVLTPVLVTPTTATLTLTTFAPTITNPQTFTPTTATLVLTTFAPGVAVAGAVPPAIVLAATLNGLGVYSVNLNGVGTYSETLDGVGVYSEVLSNG